LPASGGAVRQGLGAQWCWPVDQELLYEGEIREGRERMKQRERWLGQRVKERRWLRMVTMTIVLGGNSLLLLLAWIHWSLL
jgi:hypothetical protein